MKYSNKVYDRVMEAFEDFKEEVLDILEDCEDYSDDYAEPKEVKPKFKAGVKVKVIDDKTPYKKGSIHIVSAVYIDEDGDIFIGLDEEDEGYWFEHHFELVKVDEKEEKASSVKPSFKVGQKVLIKKDLVAYKEYGNSFFVTSMEKYRGKEAFIKSMSDLCDGVYLDIDGGEWCWTPEMLEEAKEEVKERKPQVGDLVKIVSADTKYIKDFHRLILGSIGTITHVYPTGVYDVEGSTKQGGIEKQILCKENFELL